MENFKFLIKIKKVAIELIKIAFAKIFNKKLIFIDKSSHIAYDFHYKNKLPGFLKSKTDYLTNIGIYINRTPSKRYPRYHKFIVEFEHPYMIGNGGSRNYKFMKNRFKNSIKELASINCVAATALSNKAKETLINITPNEYKNEIPNKIFVVRPSIDLSIHKKDNRFKERNQFEVLHVTSKFVGKGTFLIIEIARRILKKNPLIKFTIITNTEIKGVLPKNIEIIKVQKLSNEEKKYYYSKASLFAFPCLHDSFGVYLEALAYSLPIISTDIYDKDEFLFEGKNSFLIETPLSLWRDINSDLFETYDEFCKLAISYYKKGLFDKLINAFIDKILMIFSYSKDSNNYLDSLSYEARSTAKKFFSQELRSQKLNKIIKNHF